MSNEIGKIKKVPLREVWKKEDTDFTVWLYENLDVLAEELNIEHLEAIEREKRVGIFYADIIAEDNTEQTVVIENQLEKTNHTHLGQILTYVSNLDDVKIAIWISSEPRPEHIRAVDWLNETASEVDFYLIKMEAYKIGNSSPAPKFIVLAGPSEKTKSVGEEHRRDKSQRGFWESLLKKSKQKTALYGNRTTSKASWISTGTGVTGLRWGYNIHRESARVALYIDCGKDSQDRNKQIFDTLYSQKLNIEKMFGDKLRWDRLDDKRASRISKTLNKSGLDDPSRWGEIQDDMIDAMIRLEKALIGHIRKISRTAQ